MTMTEFDFSSLQHVTLVADTSESGAPYWEETRQTTLAIFERLGRRCVAEIYLLGNGQPTSQAAVAQLYLNGLATQQTPCSLVAPTLRAVLRRWQRTQAVVLIGNGEIFDLADWVGHEAIERWIIIQSGPDRLQARPMVEVLVPQQIEQALALLTLPAEPRHKFRIPPLVSVSNRSYRWELDRAGYPMIWVEPLGAFVHLFPVTKAQFERFLAKINTPAWGDSWYAQLLALNPRSVLDDSNPCDEHLFITGLLPEEVVQFGRWLGPNYTLLTSEQWRTCYEWLAERSSSTVAPTIEPVIAPDARAMWERIEAERQPRSLLDLTLMQNGVIEWTVDPLGGVQQRHVGMGKTRPGYGPLALRRAIDPLLPIAHTTQQRFEYIGFRMMTRDL
jgi:hypothetical protein